MIPLRVIMGPTASGKSALALEYAERLNGEIVSVDSMQLYRGLEIGTAQPTAAEKARIVHHLVGVWDIHEKADVFRYCAAADAAIADIIKRGRTPILVGGTGFYFKALLHGLDDLPGEENLRRELDEKYDSPAGEAALRARLSELDPAAAKKFASCRRKMIRALEVRLLAGKSILELQQNQADRRRYEFAALRLEMPAAKLNERIALRAEKMLSSGWIEEARTALDAGLLNTPSAWQAIGYATIGSYLAGKINAAEMRDQIIISTRQYARRQRTWFRHQHPEAEILSC